MASGIGSKKSIGMFTLVMITAALLASARNFPTMAELGLQLIFFALIAAIGFLIPTALVSAELATGWPKQGGVYVWVKEAFGERWGFVAIWLQWIMMIFAMIAILAFIAGTVAFIFNPALANAGWFIFAVIVVVYWGATLFSLKGIKATGRISTICFILGVAIPSILIISLGALYLLSGATPQIDLSLTFANLIPDVFKIDTMVLMAIFIMAFAGIEASAAHANEVKNPRRDYPMAILAVVLIVVLLNVLGSLSIAIVVPQQSISLVAGLMEAFTVFFRHFNLVWLIPIIALMVSFGAIGQLSSWLVSPVKGLLVTAKNGNLPPFFQKTNKSGVPKRLLFLQAILVSVVGAVFLIVQNINLMFWMFSAITVLLYLLMYFIFFAAAIRLRYKAPNVKRAYKVPGGNLGMWLIAGLGIITSLFAFIIGFFPPAQLSHDNVLFFETFLVSSVVILSIAPFVIYHFRKPAWKTAKTVK